jgi:DUF1365 family protein
MGVASGLIVAKVAHARLRPKRNAFTYRMYYLCLPLTKLAQAGALRVLSLDRFNLFSLHARDHEVPADGYEAWIRGILAQWNIAGADGEIVLLTLPRVLGYVFNPVSFWFCLNQSGALVAVLSEVRNTFGERHCYLSFHDDGKPIHDDDWMTAKKVFHVSPFIPVEGEYAFRFIYHEAQIGVWINHHDNDGLLLTTSLVGTREELDDRTLLRCFFRYPLITLKVIGLIHYQALKLVRKGIVYRRKPAPPHTEVSR